MVLPLLAPAVARAQQPHTFFNDTLPPPAQAKPAPPQSSTPPKSDQAKSEQADDDDNFIKPSRPGIANPADIQKAGVLQLEYGYDGSFRAKETGAEHKAPLALRFAASDRLLLELDLDTVTSQLDPDSGRRVTGVGDTQLGAQWVALHDDARHPALAFAYYLKVPTAREGLGSGRFDHKLIWLLSRKFGEATDLDFNAAYLLQGREDADGWLHGGQGALSLAHELNKQFGIQGELSGQSLDEALPRGLYALGALTYKANRRAVFDAGVRFGLNPEAPRVGLFAGVTIGVVDFFKHRR